MRRSKLVWFAVGAVVVVSILLTALFLPLVFPRSRHLYVNRTVNSPSEKQALTAAETIDYANIVLLDRFKGPSNAIAYIHRDSYLSYTWANFIDSEVIDYYQNRYDYQQKQLSPKIVTFTYNAKATYLEQLHIFNITKPEQYIPPAIGIPDYQNETFTWNNITIVFHGPDKTTPLKSIGPDIQPFYFERFSSPDGTTPITKGPTWNIFYKNQTTFNKIQPEFDLTFNNCYLIEMDLTYNETYSRLAGFYVDLHHIVVLDQNFEPLWISTTPPFHAIS